MSGEEPQHAVLMDSGVFLLVGLPCTWAPKVFQPAHLMLAHLPCGRTIFSSLPCFCSSPTNWLFQEPALTPSLLDFSSRKIAAPVFFTAHPEVCKHFVRTGPLWNWGSQGLGLPAMLSEYPGRD